MIKIGDIDIDVVDRDVVLQELKHIPAIRLENDIIKKHNTGVYVQDIEFDPSTGYAIFDHKEKNDLIKVDFLNFNALKKFISNDQLEKLSNMDPDWTLLQDKDFVEDTIHIHNWFDNLKDMNVDSVDKLAMFLGIIRPGKEYLRGKPWNVIERSVWNSDNSKYSFKKSHAYSYALTIVALMNLKMGR